MLINPHRWLLSCCTSSRMPNHCLLPRFSEQGGPPPRSSATSLGDRTGAAALVLRPTHWQGNETTHPKRMGTRIPKGWDPVSVKLLSTRPSLGKKRGLKAQPIVWSLSLGAAAPGPQLGNELGDEQALGMELLESQSHARNLRGRLSNSRPLIVISRLLASTNCDANRS